MVELKFGCYYEIKEEWFALEEGKEGGGLGGWGGGGGVKGEICLSMVWEKPTLPE